jgi:hypothetical protein
MARTSQQGVSALTVWLIVFVFFWLLSTVWLVVMYTGQTELKSTAERFRREAERLATSQEISSIELVKNLSDGGPTAVGVLEEARAETARLATGEPKDAAAAVRTKRDAFLGRIRTDGFVSNAAPFEDASLLAALNLLYENFGNEHKLRLAAETRVAELDAEISRQVQLVADLKADFEQGLPTSSPRRRRSGFRSARKKTPPCSGWKRSSSLAGSRPTWI